MKKSQKFVQKSFDENFSNKEIPVNVRLKVSCIYLLNLGKSFVSWLPMILAESKQIQ